MKDLSLRWVEIDSDRWNAAREIRNKELLRPIGLPDHSREADDSKALHLVALRDDRVVGVVLLVSDRPPKLRQMAVCRTEQGLGVGRRLVEELLRRARELGYGEVVCHARASATPFYERCGFQAEGEPFEEVGVEHRFMRCRLE